MLTAIVALSGAMAVAAASQTPAEKSQQKPPEKASKSAKPSKAKTVSMQERLDALSRATVWQEPPPIATANLGADPTDPHEVTCTFEISHLNGTAPKFDCRTENGDRLRVKYGRSPEIPSEVAATRLMHAIGFGADDMMLVEKLRCYGCPLEPFLTMKTLGMAGEQQLYSKVMDPKSFKDFEWAAIEHKHWGRPIETQEVEGWAFFELDVIDPKKGGSPRAYVDALRLLAVFLSHWDNKSENQRLVCLSEKDWPEGGKCSHPFAMLQDVGSTFGPRKVDIKEWVKSPMWSDRASCTASMDALPYHGATFKPVKISEAGRKHLGGLLTQLTDRQLETLFRDARFDHATGLIGGVKATPIEEWVTQFKARVAKITDGPPCPQ
ncbi:MAG: hypothetical protein ABI983_00345 [Acidobacteriota bacterium]